MVFRQLFEPISSTYTYLVADPDTRRAVLIDPVLDEIEAYSALLAELGLELAYTLETHVHADHVTAADTLRQRFGSRTVLSRDAGAPCADALVADGDRIQLDGIELEVIATPGHTAGCVSYRTGDRVFTGDALLIGGCGRTDFQGGDAGRLYDSITNKLFALPDETLVFPAHDYKGRTSSTIGAEKESNARLGGGRSRDAFIALMAALELPRPKQIDRAVPANLACGRVAPTQG
jgi:glyoxylase-like metal-dependent hydrolase (beta-lactamase superfamily II)